MIKRISDYYFFGCKSANEKGHYLHLPGYLYTRPECWLDLPKQWQRNLNGTLCPRGQQQIEGMAALHHLKGWTALAFWDRSADHRPNSNSVFLASGDHAFEDMLRIAGEQFPEVIARLRFSIFET